MEAEVVGIQEAIKDAKSIKKGYNKKYYDKAKDKIKNKEKYCQACQQQVKAMSNSHHMKTKKHLANLEKMNEQNQ